MPWHFGTRCIRSFGITVPLIQKMLETCTQLSQSQAIASVIGVSSEGEVSEGLRVILFRMLLFFRCDA